MGRREEVSDAAVTVVASTGLKGLTHRAVDEAAGVPAGTTSNYFRTREALVAAVAQRIETRDHEIWATLGPAPVTFIEFTEWLGRFAVAMAADHAELSRVRLSLFLADSEPYTPGHQRFLASIAQALDGFGVADSAAVATAYLDYLDGLILHVATVRQGRAPAASAVAANLRRFAG